MSNRTCSDHCGSSDQNTNSDIRLTNSTSQWTYETLKLLKISVVKETLYPPLEFSYEEDANPELRPFVEWLKDVVLKTRYVTTYNMLKMKVKRVLDHLKMYKPLYRLDFDNIEQIKDHETYLFQESLDMNSSDITSTLPVLKPADHLEKSWYQMFHGSAENFAADLKYTLSLYENHHSIPESVYSTLFLGFIGMFGLRGVAVPSFPVQTICIDDKEVKSSANILLLDRLNVKRDTHGAFKTNILAVIKVKEKCQESYHPTPAKLQKKEELPHINKKISIDNNLIGQHGGELIIHRQLSSSDQGIMGMIVQGTHVTFTYFSCNKEQLDQIKCGAYDNLDNPPSLMFSKSYNYLKASDRELLIEPLLILGLLQKCP